MRLNSPMRLVAKACTAAIIAGAGLCATAFAASYTMDDAFRAEVESVRASLAQGDSASAQARAQAMIASADQPMEKYVASELMYQAAGNRYDLRAQRIALNAMLESGEAPQAKVAKLRAQAGILSSILGDRKDAIAQIEYANQQGFSSAQSQLALADARFQRNDNDGGLKAMTEAFALRAKEDAKPIEESWYDRAIALSYKAKRPDMVESWTSAKLIAYPSPANWRSAVVNYLGSATAAPDQSLDLYRLMAATDGMASERDWLAYSTVAGQKGSAAEAKAALDAGVTAGDLDPADAGVKKELLALKPKATKALAEIPTLTTKAKSGNGAAALAAANAQFAAASFPAAAELYRAALTKGGVDTGLATTRLGIALARSGDLEGGKATLASVTDTAWLPVAHFWTAWTERKIVRNPA